MSYKGTLLLNNWVTTFKVILIVLATGVVISEFDKLRSALNFLSENTDLNLISILIILTFFNVGLEGVKWKISAQRLEKTRFATACKAVLVGSYISFLLPGRVGSFLGKIAELRPDNRISGTILSWYNGWCQSLTTVLFGLMGLILFQGKLDLNEWNDSSLYLSFAILAAGLIWFTVFTEKLPFHWFGSFIKEDIMRKIEVLNTLSGSYKTGIITVSILRSLTYHCSYIFAMIFLSEENVLIVDIIPAIWLALAITSFIPATLFGKVVFREIVFVALMGTVLESEIIISVTLLVWLMNVVLPALIGGLLSFTVKVIGNK